MMPKPGTRVTGEDICEREIDGIKVTETTIAWNGTDAISVDYHASSGAGGVDMYADQVALTSFDGPLEDEALRALMVDNGVL